MSSTISWGSDDFCNSQPNNGAHLPSLFVSVSHYHNWITDTIAGNANTATVCVSDLDSDALRDWVADNWIWLAIVAAAGCVASTFCWCYKQCKNQRLRSAIAEGNPPQSDQLRTQLMNLGYSNMQITSAQNSANHPLNLNEAITVIEQQGLEGAMQ